MADNAYDVTVLKMGYSFVDPEGKYRADGSVSLVKGTKVILVDTGGPADKETILEALQNHGVHPGKVDYVIGTHGHSDHIGNLNLFPNATVIVSHDICKGDEYFEHDFKSQSYRIDENVEVISTPGHTSNDVSVLVRNTNLGTVCVAGDLFEKEQDLADCSLWKANSEYPEIQDSNRKRVLEMADYIIPGHGPMFKVPSPAKDVSIITRGPDMEASCKNNQSKMHEKHFDPCTYAVKYTKSSVWYNSDNQSRSDMMRKSKLDHLFAIFNTGAICGSRLLEVGCGPCIDYAIIPSLYFDEVYLSDYLEACTREVSRWWKEEEGAIDWSHVFQYVASLQRNRMPMNALEYDLRRKIKGVLQCDVLKENPLDFRQPEAFACITTSLCLEAACNSLASFQQSLLYLSKLLKPGGHFVMATVLGNNGYYAGDNKIECLNLTAADVLGALQKAGLCIQSSNETNLEKYPSSPTSGLYRSCLTTYSRKD